MRLGTCRLLALSAVVAASVVAIAQEETNYDELTRISARERIRAIAEKQEAVRMAPLWGIPIRGTFHNGGVFELMAIRNGRPLFVATDNANAAISTRVNLLYPGGGKGLNLTGFAINLGIWDGGWARTTHQELTGRVTAGDAGEAANQDHATHVAGTMIASGVDPTAKGMAYEGTLSTYGWNSDTAEMAAAAAAGMRLSNHSYGFLSGWHPNVFWYWWGDTRISETEDNGFGQYDGEAVVWDTVAYNAPFYLPVKSAGNDRGQGPITQPFGHYVWDYTSNSWIVSNTVRDLDGGTTGYDTLPYNSTSKNALIVGAVQDVLAYAGPGDVLMSTFSGWGPTDDGRIKPDLVANGVALNSSLGDADDSYGSFSGTSMSAPNATGTLGVLLQHWRNLGNKDPRSSTMKAIAIHSAREAGTYLGPDYAFGWGLLDAAAAADLMTLDDTLTSTITERRLRNGETHSFWVYADPGTLKATIAWIDKPGTAADPSVLDPSDSRLVNDLDMRIYNTAGGTFYPWYLTPANPDWPAYQGDNSRDNVEQVQVPVIAPPTAPSYPGSSPGWHKITVTHKGTLSSPNYQIYSLVITGVSKFLTVKNVTADPADVIGSYNVTGRVQLSHKAPAGGVVVQLSSNSAKVTVPATVTVPAGAGGKDFTMKTLSVDTNTLTKVSATLAPSSKSVDVVLVPGGLKNFYLSSDSVVGGNNLEGTITLSGPAPFGGRDVIVGDDSIKITTPSLVNVPETKTIRKFQIQTLAVNASQNRTVFAKLGGRQITRTLTLNPVP